MLCLFVRQKKKLLAVESGMTASLVVKRTWKPSPTSVGMHVKFSLILDVKTCAVFVSCATIVNLLFVVLPSLSDVNGEVHRFLH